MKTTKQGVALKSVLAGLCTCVCLSTAFADDAHQAQARADQSKAESRDGAAKVKPAKAKAKNVRKAADSATPPSAATAATDAQKPPVAAPPTNAPAPQPEAAQVDPVCKLGEAEQPRGGRLDVHGDRFGSAPVVRIEGKPTRILLRKQDRISVQIPADSNGGEITLLNDGKVASCGTLVIIGKDR
jgi:hypothetical protein